MPRPSRQMSYVAAGASRPTARGPRNATAMTGSAPPTISATKPRVRTSASAAPERGASPTMVNGPITAATPSTIANTTLRRSNRCCPRPRGRRFITSAAGGSASNTTEHVGSSAPSRRRWSRAVLCSWRESAARCNHPRDRWLTAQRPTHASPGRFARALRSCLAVSEHVACYLDGR